MKTMMQRWMMCAATMCVALLTNAQGVQLTIAQYEDMKAAGTLPSQFHVEYSTIPQGHVKPSVGHAKGGGNFNGTCNCWIEPDTSYTVAMPPNDDGSTGLFTLPFQFNLYGDLYNQCYINNNGNVSFVAPYFTYTAEGFPSANYKMVAPFWSDVDTRPANGGVVYYKITPTAMYVAWDSVGYYGMQTDKLNSFQLIITDGTDPVLGAGKNVSFCYHDMQWTTGQASCLTPTSCTYGGNSYSCSNVNNLGYGFCGSPSTVGANRGDGVDYIQFTRNDHPGTDYDGPFGNTDGVSWLDNKNFVFNTAVNTQNIPPIASSSSLCDTVRVCMNELVHININYLSPEAGQLTTSSFTISPPLIATITVTNNSPANTSSLDLQFIPTVNDTGFHTITFTATDDGAPPLTSINTIVIQVYYTLAVPPVITGDTISCGGAGVVLTADTGYYNYHWTNGYDGPSVLVGAGTYLVQAYAGQCKLASNWITVTDQPNPVPVITGQLFTCSGQPAVLTTTLPYPAYLWSNGDTTATDTVGTGQYTVTVTSPYGCVGTSAPVDVLIANNPTAFFISDHPNPVFPGTTIIYTDQSSANGGTIVTWSWHIDTLNTSGSGLTFTQIFNTPGTYPVVLTVTTSDGCTHTFVYNQLVIPTEVFVPNVFSPNGDGHNDALEFTGVEYFPNSWLLVYNRWGNLIYENRSYKNTWSPAKTDAPEGTYFYILRVSNGKEYSGPVTLLR